MISPLISSLLLCLGVHQDGLRVFVEDPKKDLRILTKVEDAGSFRAAAGHLRFDVGQFPILQKNSSGLQLSTDHLSGSYSAIPGGSYRIDSLLALGHAVLTYDSDVARNFQIASGETPTGDPEAKTTLSTESIDLKQKNSIQTLTLDKAFKMKDERSGTSTEGPFNRSSEVTGNSGTFTFITPMAPGRAKLSTGEVDGPVHLHSTQISKEAESMMFFGLSVPLIVPVTRVIDATGDHLSIDMSKKEDQIVLLGHVVLHDSLWGTNYSDELKATLDDAGSIVSIAADRLPKGGAVSRLGAKS